MSDETIGSDNERQINRRNAIADALDAGERAAELEEIDDAQHDLFEDAEKEEEPAKPVKKEVGRTLRLKINGQDVDLTEEEVIARAQKVEFADRYVADKKREADEILAQARKVAPSVQDAPVKETKPFDQNDLILARTLQMGSEEEAAQAIATIRKATPLVDADAVATKAVDRLRFEEDSRWFQEQYSDIFADPQWRDLALLLDEKAVKAGDDRPYRERYKSIGEQVQKWMGKTGTNLEDRRERKAATAAPLKQASAVSREVEDPDEDDNPKAIIARMAKSRGQLIA